MRRHRYLAAALAMTMAVASRAEVTTAAGVETAIAQAMTDGRPVVLEFTAPWCAGCRELAQMLAEPAVRRDLGCAELVVVSLAGAPHDPRNLRITERYRVPALPLLAFIDRDGREHEDLRLTGAVSAPRVQHSLAGVC